MGCEQSISVYDNDGQKLDRRDAKYKKLKVFNGNDEITENVIKSDIKLSEEDIGMIEKILSKHFFFYKLTKAQKAYFLEQIQIYTADKGQRIFNKGDSASMFFLIKSGLVKVQVDKQDCGQKILKKGDGFGQLALLYKAPRSASITAIQNCYFFCITNKIFRKTMQEMTIKNYDIAKEFIQNARIFNYLTSRQKNAIAYNAHILKYQKGEVIFKEGDDANSFFMVMKGIITIQIHGKSNIVMTEGQSFGQNSFQKSQVRNGTAKALQKTQVISIGREALKKCIGNALDQLSCYNIMKWSMRRHQALKNLSDLQREKIISIVQIKQFRDGQVIINKGEVSKCFLICLEQKIDSYGIGSIHNVEYAFEKDENQMRLLKPLIKKGTGKVAVFQYALVKKSLGKRLDQCLDEKTKSLNQLNDKKRSYLSNLTLNQFNVKYSLGEGMFGKVLCVEDQCKKLYALKCILKKKIISQEMEHFIINQKNFLEEVNSSFIVKLYKTFYDQNFAFLLMKYIDGGDFFHILQSFTEFDKEKAQFYFACIISAVDALHQKNIVYRDIKPQNAVADREGFLYLIDFGTTKKLTEEKGFRTFTIIGTPHYMAPEIVQGRGYSFPVDLWSLGIFFFEVLCGYLPFGPNCSDPYQVFHQISNTKLTFPQKYTDKSGIELIQKLLTKNQGEREMGDLSKLKNMQFFEDFNWEQLEAKQMETPFTINRQKLNKLVNIPLIDYLPVLLEEKTLQMSDTHLRSKNQEWNKVFENPLLGKQPKHFLEQEQL